jgi:hypothetical protein
LFFLQRIILILKLQKRYMFKIEEVRYHCTSVYRNGILRILIIVQQPLL